MSPRGPCPSTLLFARGGDEEIRTLDPLLAGQVLSQLSYTPIPMGSFLRTLKIEQQKLLESFHSLSRLVRKTRLVSYLDEREEPRLPCCFLHRKEVIQPHLPIRLPCYDLTPIIEPTFGCSLLAVRTQTSGLPDFHGLTGGVYKARERIHRSMLTCDY